MTKIEFITECEATAKRGYCTGVCQYCSVYDDFNSNNNNK